MKNETCEFYGCDKPLDVNWQPEEGMKLCKEHSDEFDRLVDLGDSSTLMKFVFTSYYGGL